MPELIRVGVVVQRRRLSDRLRTRPSGQAHFLEGYVHLSPTLSVCSFCVTPGGHDAPMFDEPIMSREEVFLALRECEQQVAAVRARQVHLLRGLLRRDPDPGADELAGALDVSQHTARDLLEAARRTPERSQTIAKLESGSWSFDRVAAVAALVGVGADDATVAQADERDIAGIRRLRALQQRITRRTEHEAHSKRSVRSWASLDESVGFIHAELTGYDWRVVTKALEDRADLLPRDTQATAGQRRADALVALSQDWLSGGSDSSTTSRGGPVVTVIVDAALASATGAEAGVMVANGPRVGPETMDRIMCAGSVEVLVDTGPGVPLGVGPTTRVIPPKLRRFILGRDQGCTVDGCQSNYRLEVHHIVPRSQGGTNDPANLVTLCWWHHHVAIHGRGMRIDPTSPPHRRQLIPAGRSP